MFEDSSQGTFYFQCSDFVCFLYSLNLGRNIVVVFLFFLGNISSNIWKPIHSTLMKAINKFVSHSYDLGMSL